MTKTTSLEIIKTKQLTPSEASHSTFPALSFKFSWRPEQKRVLAKLDSYLGDKRIHIVAAPGAGKTVIGLDCGTVMDSQDEFRARLMATHISLRLVRCVWCYDVHTTCQIIISGC